MIWLLAEDGLKIVRKHAPITFIFTKRHIPSYCSLNSDIANTIYSVWRICYYTIINNLNMLEAGVNPALCRNGYLVDPRSPIQHYILKSENLEQDASQKC